jgi:hypothetical protein
MPDLIKAWPSQIDKKYQAIIIAAFEARQKMIEGFSQAASGDEQGKRPAKEL